MKISIADLELALKWLKVNTNDTQVYLDQLGSKTTLAVSDRNGKSATIVLYSTEVAMQPTITATDTLASATRVK